MTEKLLPQLTIDKIDSDDFIEIWIEPFLVDKKVQNKSKNTIRFYRSELKLFLEFCDTVAIKRFSQITPNEIRNYLLWLEQTGHNPGGRHAAYRSLKVFMRWWWDEIEPEGFKNPIYKVKAPKVQIEPLEPVSVNSIRKLIETCTDKNFYDLRDKALFFFLFDTGARAAETCALHLKDIDQKTGTVLIRSGKGGFHRTVFIGRITRKAIRAYLRYRINRFDDGSPLWSTVSGEPLTYWGLNEILKRRSHRALIIKPGLHDFRRAFALNALRPGMDIESLRLLLGHKDYQVIQRYLKENTEDLRIAHHKASPVDNKF